VATYVRRGESENAWFSPTHLVTFYRYLRFHPSGQVLSLLTTDTPSDTVKKLKPGLRRKGFTIGKWRLRGNQITCWDLEEPGVGEGERKYSFVMECELKSTSRGKM
jgi:F-box protein 9